MEKRIIFGFLLGALFFNTSAFAQNVASTSQHGSLLIFPLVDVRTGNSATTQIKISNDQNLPVHVECYYMNERKGRREFDFFLSPKQSVFWDVLTQTGEGVTPAGFPNDGTFPGDAAVGELICFAVDPARSTQVRFNHLTGTATVVYLSDTDAGQPVQAFEYNAWAFAARSALVPPPPDGSPVGVPGVLLLTGGADGTYDARLAYLTADFSPIGATLGGVTYLDNHLSVSICNQVLGAGGLLQSAGAGPYPALHQAPV